jgi:hypothetical protein
MHRVIFPANTNKTTQWLKILKMNKIQLQRLKEYSHDLKKTEESATMKCINHTAS